MKTALQRTLEAAQELRAANRLGEALDKLVAFGQAEPRISVLRGEIEFALGRVEEAALSYFTAIAAEPDQAAGVHYNLALCLQRLKRWDAAGAAFQKALRLEPVHSEARLGLGLCLLELDRPEEAVSVFEQGCRGVKRAPFLFGKAVASQMLGRFNDARRAYDLFLAANPKSQEALANVIALNKEAGDLKGILEHSSRLLEICPHSTVALQGLATVALERQEHPAAARYCDRIVELDPGCLEAWHNLRIAMDRVLCASAGTGRGLDLR